MRPSSDVCDDVLTGTSASRRDQPIEFSDSRNDVDAILLGAVGLGRFGRDGLDGRDGRDGQTVVPGWFGCRVFCTAQAVRTLKRCSMMS